MAVPYTFGSILGGASIPLSELDDNFSYLTTSPTFTGNVTVNGILDVNGNESYFGGSNPAAYNGINILNTSPTGYCTVAWVVGAAGANGVANVNYAPGVFLKFGVLANDTTSPIVFVNNNDQERMRIAANGNVGIGTSSPGAKLHVSGGNATNVAFNGSTRGIRFDFDGTQSNIIGVDNTFFGSYQPLFISGSYLALGTGLAEHARIDASGNVGIGTSNPTTKLTVDGTITATGGATFSSTLNVAGITTLSNNLSVAGSSTFTGGATFSSSITFDSQTITGTTGTGNFVLSVSPTVTSATLVAPALGTPTSGNLTNCTNLPLSSVTGLGTGVENFLAVPSSANLAAAVTGETGTGALVFGTNPTLTNPTLTTPTLGTPQSGSLINCTNLPVSSILYLAPGIENFLVNPTSTNLATAVTDETGSGSLVFATSPSLTTPNLTGSILAAGTATVAPLNLTSGTNLTSPIAGAIEYDGVNIFSTTTSATGRGYIPSTRRFTLFSAGSAITTIANYFGANSNIPLTANAVYDIEIVFYYSKGSVGGTVVWTLENSAAPTLMNVYYEMSPATGIVSPPGNASMLVGQDYGAVGATYSITTASLTASVFHYAKMNIYLANGSGTSLKIQATSNGSDITPRVGSYWKVVRIPDTNNGTYAA